MTHDQIRKALLGAIAKVAPEADPATLQPAQGLRDQLEIDSFDFLKIVIALRDALGVEVPESDYARLDTIDSAVAYLAGRLERT